MDDRKGLGQSLLLAVAPAVVSSLLTGVATWSFAVRDAKKASTEQATERDQVVFATLRDRIAAIEGSVEDMTKVVEKVARPGSHISAGRTTAKAPGRAPARELPSEAPAGTATTTRQAPSPTGPAPSPTAPAPAPAPEAPGDDEGEGGKRVLFEVLDRLKDQLPKSPLPQNVRDLPLYTQPKK